jgi:hypothetical protein
MARPPKGLHVGDDLTLPLDAITQSIALLAVRRAGKSNAAAVIAEEMYHAGLPWVAIDPKGDWWGLRSSGDGNGPGLPIPIFGGLHGDMPLLPEAGKLVADLIVEQNLTCALDVSEFASKAAQMRFLADLGERLFRLHGRHPQPRHIFLEEADDVIPQRVMGDMARCVGAWSKLVKQGGSRGLGITLISQRSAVVNKDALTQTETMIVLRTTSPQDTKAILEWVKYHAVAQEIVESLAGLDDGEAWVISPHWLGRHGQPAIQRIRFRRRATFDSGSTPTLAQRRRPATIADIDLGALTERMAAVVEKAAADDPAALRRKIASFERQMKGVTSVGDEVTRLTAENRDLRAELAQALIDLQQASAETVEVPVLAPGDLAAVEQVVTALRDTAGSLEIALSRAARPPAAAPAPPARRQPERIPPPADAWPRTIPDPGDPSGLASLPVPDVTLSKAQRAALTVLAQFPDGRTKRQLAMLAGYSAKGGGFNNALSSLRTSGLIERGEPIVITPAGLAVLGDDWEPLPEGAALIDHWMGQLSKAEGLALGALLDAYPQPLSKAEVAERAGYAADGGGFNNALSRLRTLQLIDGRAELRPDETLAAVLAAGSTRC